MSDMRRLAQLLLQFKKQEDENGKVLESATSLDMFDRTNFPYLLNSIEAVTTNEEGSIKAGLKIGLGYLLKRVAKFLNGECLIQKKNKEAKEIRRYQEVLDFYWAVIFRDAEYKVNVVRHKELRLPQRLPLEEDVAKLRDWLQTNISSMCSFEFISSSEFADLRDMIVCRLTLFNARRGGEPVRLLLTEWEDADNDVWFGSDLTEEVNDPIEHRLLMRHKSGFPGRQQETCSAYNTM